MSRTVLGTVALAAAVGATAVVAFRAGQASTRAQPEPTLVSLAQPAEQPSPEEMAQMMEQMLELGQPGEHHTKLMRGVGNWTVDSEFASGPGQMIQSSGTVRVTSVLGGRFVRADFKLDDFMGQPFHGVGYTGYDNGKKKYVGVWMDTMSTGIYSQTGSMDGDVMTMVGVSAMGTPMKIVSEHVDDDHIVDTFYDQMPDGTWVKSGTMRSTRVGAHDG